MRVLDRVCAWWRRARRIRYAIKYPEELREFIYLDETSVYSLLASKAGTIATDFTDTATTLIRGEASGSVGAGGASGGLKVETSRTNAAQVVRKAIIQSHFRELRAYIEDQIILGREPAAAVRWDPDKSENVNIENLVDCGSAIPVNKLERGKLIELDVRLSTDYLYRISTFIELFGELSEDDPERFGVEASAYLQGLAMGRMLEKILIGLVPLRCEIVGYERLLLGGQQYVARSDAVRCAPDHLRRPVFLAGVTEQNLYWKDLRRVLFADLSVKVLARVSTPGILNQWNPAKLSGMVSSFVPDFEKNISSLAKMIGLRGAAESTPLQNLTPALLRYSELLCDEYGVQLSTRGSESVQSLAIRLHGVEKDGEESVRRAMNQIGEAVRSDLGVHDIDSVKRYELRRKAREVAMLSPAPGMIGDVNYSDDKDSPCYIDSEIIAMYW